MRSRTASTFNLGCLDCETLLVCPRHGESHWIEHDETTLLCEGHAHAYGVTSYTSVPAAHEQTDPDEPIQCERCSLAIMRALGVL